MSAASPSRPKSERVAVGVRDVGNAVHEGAEVGLVPDRGEAHRAVGHAVVRPTAGDDLVAAREAAHGLDLLGDLDRGLDRFGATGGEVDPVEVAGRQLGQGVGQLSGRAGRKGGGGDVGQLRGLAAHDLADLGPAVPGVDDPETGDAVEVGLAVAVPERRALAALEDVQALALGQFGPRLGMDPDVIQRLLVDVQRRAAQALGWWRLQVDHDGDLHSDARGVTWTGATREGPAPGRGRIRTGRPGSGKPRGV